MAEPQSLGAMVAEGMKSKGLDYRSLGKLVGVSHGYLWQLVNADKRALNAPELKRKRPSEAVARQLAATLELDPAAVLSAAGYGPESAEALPAGPTRYTVFVPPGRQLYLDGVAAMHKGQDGKAVALLEAAIAQGDVSFLAAHMGLGLAHLGAGRPAEAEAQFGQAIEAMAREGEASSGPAPADVHYNRGLARQRLARQLKGEAQKAKRRAAQADFRQAIALEGEHQDLYHSALAYLWLERGAHRRVLALGRSFLHRQAIGPTRHTTAALDLSLYMAYAHMAVGELGPALALADLTLQLCPNYWFAHFVKGALLAHGATAPERRRVERLAAGMVHLRRAVKEHPAARGHLKAERHGDFAAWADAPEFLALLGPHEEA